MLKVDLKIAVLSCHWLDGISLKEICSRAASISSSFIPVVVSGYRIVKQKDLMVCPGSSRFREISFPLGVLVACKEYDCFPHHSLFCISMVVFI